MTLEIARKNFPIGQRVTKRMNDRKGYVEGTTAGDVVDYGRHLKVLVKWEGNIRNVENINDLSPQPDLSFLN